MPGGCAVLKFEAHEGQGVEAACTLHAEGIDALEVFGSKRVASIARFGFRGGASCLGGVQLHRVHRGGGAFPTSAGVGFRDHADGFIGSSGRVAASQKCAGPALEKALDLIVASLAISADFRVRAAVQAEPGHCVEVGLSLDAELTLEHVIVGSTGCLDATVECIFLLGTSDTPGGCVDCIGN